MRKQEIDYLLTNMSGVFEEVTELNITPGNPFRAERWGQLIGIEVEPAFYELTPFQTEIFALVLMNQNPQLIKILLSKGTCGFYYTLSDNLRFSVNIVTQRNIFSITLRKEEADVEVTPDLDGLDLSDEALEKMLETTEFLTSKNGELSLLRTEGRNKEKVKTKPASDSEQKSDIEPGIISKDKQDPFDLELDDLDDIEIEDFSVSEVDSGIEEKKESSHLNLNLEPDGFYEETEDEKDTFYYGDETMDDGDSTQVFEVGIPGTSFQKASPKASSQEKGADKQVKAEEEKPAGSLGVLKKLGKLFTGRSDRTRDEKSPEYFKPKRFGSAELYPENKDPVDCTIFSPKNAERGERILLQVFLHLVELMGEPSETTVTKAESERSDKRFTSLETDADRGSEFTFELNLPGINIPNPIQQLEWQGKTASVSYDVEIPLNYNQENLSGKVIVAQTSVPIGHIRFKLKVGDEILSSEKDPEPMGRARRYKQAFLSYASENRSEVLRSALVLSSLKIGIYQETLKLTPRERWERKLYKKINEADVFFLFWSAAARRSEWVMREALHAIRLKDKRKENSPEIIPVIIGESSPVPPAEFRHLGFNNRAAYFTSAISY